MPSQALLSLLLAAARSSRHGRPKFQCLHRLCSLYYLRPAGTVGLSPRPMFQCLHRLCSLYYSHRGRNRGLSRGESLVSVPSQALLSLLLGSIMMWWSTSTGSGFSAFTGFALSTTDEEFLGQAEESQNSPVSVPSQALLSLLPCSRCTRTKNLPRKKGFSAFTGFALSTTRVPGTRTRSLKLCFSAFTGFALSTTPSLLADTSKNCRQANVFGHFHPLFSPFLTSG